MNKPTVLFIAEPNHTSEILSSDKFQNEFDILKCQLSTKELFLQFLKDHSSANIQAIYGGYPQFTCIGGLTRDLVYNEFFPRKQLKCITLCSRGYNSIDLDALRENEIQLFNYQDSKVSTGMSPDQVGNDVADCVLWHVLEGFRKFSFQQAQLKLKKNTLTARSSASGKQAGYAFGHELTKDGVSMMARAPRGEKCLILGLGSIGKQIGLKLHYGLGMEVHYCKTSEDPEITQKYNWKYHSLDQSLKKKLSSFKTIVIALPGTEQTTHLIDEDFLAHCDGPSLTLVNIGRGSIVKMDAVANAMRNGQLRHFGTDVFDKEPKVDNILLEEEFLSTITPHVGSSTENAYYQSCELALSNIMKVCSTDKATSDPDALASLISSRVV